MTPRELASLAKTLGSVVREHVANSLAVFSERLKAVEERGVVHGKDGRDGVDGKDGADGKSVTLDDVRPILDELVKQIPIPQNGKDGRDGVDGKDGADGKSVSLDDVRPILDEMVKQIPAPQNGKDGRDGVDGKDGAPGERGADGINGKDGAPGERGADGINGKDGAPGKDGRDGADGKSVTIDELLPTVKQWFDALPAPANGKDGAPGRDGVDGKSVTLDDIRPMLEQMQASWELNFERRAMDVLQRCVDRMPKAKDGEPGKDGLGFDDLDVQYDGERSITLVFARGEQKKEFSFELPTVIDRGVYREGASYKRFDGVTFGGSFWIAQKDTTEKPGAGTDFRLAVKKGRDLTK